jgi:hypothetical protein
MEEVAPVPDVPGKLGSLIISLDGELVSSEGELEGESSVAATIYGMLQDANVLIAASVSEPFRRISITQGDVVFIATVSRGHIYVIKKYA